MILRMWRKKVKSQKDLELIKALGQLGPANSWERKTARGMVIGPADAATRLEIVREAGELKLRDYIDWPGTQPTVRRAAQTRLARLEAARAANAK